MFESNKLNPAGKFFCVAPWLVLEVRPDGKVKPCCMSEYTYGDITKKSLWDIWNDEKIKKLRESMINDSPHPACKICYLFEKSGKVSDRKYFNELYFNNNAQNIAKFTNPDYSISTPMFVEWQVRLSNKCNFKCRTCNLTLSSSIELEETGKISGLYDTSEKTYDEVEPYLGNMECLTFVGGEPLILDKHDTILNKIIDLERTDKVTLIYNTNFSNLVYKQRHIFDLWDKFSKKVIVKISVDGVSERGELIRKNFNWNKFTNNVKQFLEKFNNNPEIYELHFQPTIQALNIFNIVELHQTLYNNGLMQNIDNILLNFLSNPREMSVWILDDQTKKEAAENIKNHIGSFLIPNGASSDTIKQFEEIINYMNFYDETQMIPQFLRTMKSYDLKRNENVAKTFPELHRIWNHFKRES